MTKPRPLPELKGNECRWPVNDAPHGEAHLFCGQPVKPMRPYCPEHCARAYVPAEPKRKAKGRA